MPDYNYSAKLDESIGTLEIVIMYAKSNLNEVFALFQAYLATHPQKDDIVDALEIAFSKRRKKDQ